MRRNAISAPSGRYLTISHNSYKNENRIPVHETNGPEGFGYLWFQRKFKQPHISMETKNKELYERPTTDAVEVKIEGVICQSPNYTGFGDEETL